MTRRDDVLEGDGVHPLRTAADPGAASPSTIFAQSPWLTRARPPPTLVGMRGWMSIATALACVACDGASTPVDGGADGATGGTDAGLSIAEPAAPSFLPCAPGWREVVADGVTTCDPYPEGGARTDCADDEAHFPGEPGCARVGTACPADGWPAKLPATGTILYVRAGATGDGSSRDAPLGSVTEALARATPGTVVAVAMGTYDEALAIGAGVTVVGACVAGTRLTNGDATLREGVVRFTGEGAVLRNLSIAGAARPGILSEATGGVSLRVEDVIVSDVIALGIALDGGRLEGRSVVVRDVEVDPASGMFGRGIGASNATVDLSRVVVERTRSTGVLAADPACRYTLTDAAVRDSFDRPDAVLGRGVTAQAGAHIELSRVVIERSREVGVAAFNPGSSIALADVVIRDTLGRGDGEYGTGIQVLEGTRVTSTRVVVERSHTHGVSAAGAGATFEGTDLLVRDTDAERSSRGYGGGVVAADGASTTLTRALVLRSRQTGIGAGGVGTTVSISDVGVRDVASDLGSGRFGVGVWAQNDAAIDGARVGVEACRTAGVGAVSGASVTLVDARVDGVESAECAATTCPDEAAAIGAVAHLYGGTIRLTRFVIRDAASCGVAVGRAPWDPADPGGAMDLEDGVISAVPVGACVQVEGFDPSRLQLGVRYEDVGIPLQATSYTLPDALPTPE